LRFWDSSAIVSLIFEEDGFEELSALSREDGEMAVWWGTWAECAVTISRLRRDGELDEGSERETRAALDGLGSDWNEIEPTNDMRLLASLLSKDHPLKTADSFQLAAALRWCEGDTGDRLFVCLDRTLRRAASDEGFEILPEAA
jgi:predicted nucleic acid-binding protein